MILLLKILSTSMARDGGDGNALEFGFCFVLFLLFFFFLNLIITIISERWFKELIALQIR